MACGYGRWHVLQVVADAGAYTEACDVWGLGVITFMLLSGTPPFKGETDSAVLQAVRMPAVCGLALGGGLELHCAV
jgi:serine/threonine protein kinase